MTSCDEARFYLNQRGVSSLDGIGTESGAKFVSGIPAECDVFYSGATLQYIEDPLQVVAAAFQSARDAVILARNNFSTRPLFRVHKSRLLRTAAARCLSASKIGPCPIRIEPSTKRM
jgi:hypothetical protein